MGAEPVVVQLDRRFRPTFVAVGIVVGMAAAFAVGPVVNWMLDRFDTAPIFLRLPAELPFPGAIAVLVTLGAAAGFGLFQLWDRSVGTVQVDDAAILIAHGANAVRLERPLVAEAFMDKDELVVLDHESREVSRTSSDGSVAEPMRKGFEQFGYPWAGTTDPRDAEFSPWIDHSPDLEDDVHTLLRTRARALADGKLGAAADARDNLREYGVIVRDRNEAQQYRVVAVPQD